PQAAASMAAAVLGIPQTRVEEVLEAHALDLGADLRRGAHVLANTRAQALLTEADSRLGPLTDLLTRVASHPAGNRGFAETITGLDTRYDMLPDTPHPWLGRLAPNLALSTGTGDTDEPADGLHQALRHWHGPAAPPGTARVPLRARPLICGGWTT
ncbi:MAG: hypothetical protein ACRDNS_22760, partial [Trebonia sp.]